MKNNKTVIAIALAVVFSFAVSAQADLLFYEGFGYPAGTDLNGTGGWSSVAGYALTGAEDLTAFADVAYTTGRLANTILDTHLTIGLDASVTATFVDGTTTWFSYITVDGSSKHSGAIGADGFALNRNIDALGQMIGMGTLHSANDLMAQYWGYDSATGFYTRHDSATNLGKSVRSLRMGKIEWGGGVGGVDKITVANFNTTGAGTITEAAFNTKVTNGQTVSIEINFDQTTFDTLSFGFDNNSGVDEIRIATAFDDIGTTLVVGQHDFNEQPKNHTLDLEPSATLPLSWINMDPNLDDGATQTYVDVWFGADKENLSQVVTGLAVSSIDVDASVVGANYWQVNSYLNGDPASNSYDTNPGDPNMVVGKIWSFTTSLNDNPPYDVSAGEDMNIWVGQSVDLLGSYLDDNKSPVTVTWTSDNTNVPNVLFDGSVTSDVSNPSITVSDTGSATLTFEVYDDVNILTPVSDTMTLTVYDTKCNADKANGVELNQSDLNEDCITDIADFAILASEWLDKVELE